MNSLSTKYWPAIGLVILTVLIVLIGDPEPGQTLARLEPELDSEIAARTYHIDPGELLELMHNNQIRLFILDVRSEADFNLFHLQDAKRAPTEPKPGMAVTRLPLGAVKVLVSNDEDRAEMAWKRLRALGSINTYMLAGGINAWLDIYSPNTRNGNMRGDSQRDSHRLRHNFPFALGAGHAAAAPDPLTAPDRKFETKVKVAKPTAAAGGGCG